MISERNKQDVDAKLQHLNALIDEVKDNSLQKQLRDLLEEIACKFEEVPVANNCYTCLSYINGYCKRHSGAVPEEFRGKGCPSFETTDPIPF